jgi:hypothetical protein
MMTYGIPADLVDDHLAMSEIQAIKSFKRFVVAMVEVFRPKYLRAPNAQEMPRLLKNNDVHSFPSMPSSIDCMHWRWKNCLAAWYG